jgi:hypothetical protein
MIKDLLISFKENIRKKSTNPFLGTYLIVLIWRNWEIIYSVLTFDKETNLSHRLTEIKKLVPGKILGELTNNIFWTFAIILTSYILINLSRLIINLFEKKLTPWIYKITDSNSIVLKEDYIKKEEEIRRLEERVEIERSLKIKYQNELDELAKRRENNSNEMLRNEMMLKDPNSNPMNRMLADKIITKNLVSDFINVGTFLENEHSWFKSIPENYNEYFNLGLVVTKDRTNQQKHIALTEEGKNVLKILRMEN